MKIAVCLASRGCINSRTIESLISEIGNANALFFFSHDNPIPVAQNYLMEKSLQYDWDYQFWIEEDVVLPRGSFSEMLMDFEKNKSINIISAPYPLSHGRLSIQFMKSPGNLGKFRFSGMGCMLIKRSLLSSINTRPFFSDEYAFNCNHSDGTSLTEKNRIVYDPKNVKIAYALQDLYFWQILLDSGGKPKFADFICDHYRFVESGNKTNNDGCHKWERIEPIQEEIDNYKRMVNQYASIN